MHGLKRGRSGGTDMRRFARTMSQAQFLCHPRYVRGVPSARAGRSWVRAKWGLMAVDCPVAFFCWMRFVFEGGRRGWALEAAHAHLCGLRCWSRRCFWLLDGQAGETDAGYSVAREVLGFLQSPLPSLLLVLLPWLARAARWLGSRWAKLRLGQAPKGDPASLSYFRADSFGSRCHHVAPDALGKQHGFC